MNSRQMEMLIAEILTDYANRLIKEREEQPDSPVPVIWHRLRLFFKEGFDLELPFDPAEASEIRMERKYQHA